MTSSPAGLLQQLPSRCVSSREGPLSISQPVPSKLSGQSTATLRLCSSRSNRTAPCCLRRKAQTLHCGKSRTLLICLKLLTSLAASHPSKLAPAQGLLTIPEACSAHRARMPWRTHALGCSVPPTLHRFCQLCTQKAPMYSSR